MGIIGGSAAMALNTGMQNRANMAGITAENKEKQDMSNPSIMNNPAKAAQEDQTNQNIKTQSDIQSQISQAREPEIKQQLSDAIKRSGNTFDAQG